MLACSRAPPHSLKLVFSNPRPGTGFELDARLFSVQSSAAKRPKFSASQQSAPSPARRPAVQLARPPTLLEEPDNEDDRAEKAKETAERGLDERELRKRRFLTLRKMEDAFETLDPDTVWENRMYCKNETKWFNKMLRVFAKTSHMSRAFKIYFLMLRRKIEANRGTFRWLFLSCVKGKRDESGKYVERVRYLFSEMRRHNLSPTLENYNHAIMACARRYDTATADAFFQEMNKDGIEPDVSTFNAMMMASGRDLASVLLWWQRLLRQSNTPPLMNFNSLIATLKRNNYHPAIIKRVFENMIGRTPAAGNSAALDAASTGQQSRYDNEFDELGGVEGDVDADADEIPKSARSRSGSDPDEKLLNSLPKPASPVAPDQRTISMILDVYIGAPGLRTPLEVLVSETLYHKPWQQQLQFDTGLLNALIRACSRLDERHLQAVLDRAVVEDVLLNPASFETLIMSWGRLGNIDKAFDAFQKFEQFVEGKNPGPRVYMGLFVACARLEDVDRVWSVWEMMEQRRVRPDASIIRFLTRFLSEHRRQDLLDKVIAKYPPTENKQPDAGGKKPAPSAPSAPALQPTDGIEDVPDPKSDAAQPEEPPKLSRRMPLFKQLQFRQQAAKADRRLRLKPWLRDLSTTALTSNVRKASVEASQKGRPYPRREKPAPQRRPSSPPRQQAAYGEDLQKPAAHRRPSSPQRQQAAYGADRHQPAAHRRPSSPQRQQVAYGADRHQPAAHRRPSSPQKQRAAYGADRRVYRGADGSRWKQRSN